jgi:hypothetical protein
LAKDRIDDYYGEVALATLPRDRWGALGLTPHQTEGSVWTAPITLPDQACQLSLNAQGVHGIALEIADEQFRFIDGFHGAQGGHVQGTDGLDCPIAWPAGDLRALAGKAVRFRISLNKQGTVEPRLFAMYLSTSSQ